jgi:gas vesicle protein
MLVNTAIFLTGMFIGAVISLIAVIILGERYLRNKFLKPESKSVPDTVITRMKKVKDITNEQLELYNQSSGPQKNALDGKYKNGLVGRIKVLEEEKSSLLRSIIEDGFDPDVTILSDDGEVVTKKLSEFMADSGISMSSKNSEEAARLKQSKRFTLHKGGKDDGTIH